MNVTLTSLPQTLPRENAVELVLEQGAIIFRASSVVQNHIEELVDKQKSGILSPHEVNELDAFEEIDEYLSHVNRLIRNSKKTARLDLPPKLSAELREAVRERANSLCEYCHTDERWQLVQFTVDHIVPLADGGSDDLENLALACFHCNRRKSDKQTVDDPNRRSMIRSPVKPLRSLIRVQ